MSVSTESWDSNFGNMSSLDDVASNGVVWDVVRLPSAAAAEAEADAESATEDATSSAITDTTFKQQQPLLRRQTSTTSASVSTVDIVRQGSLAAIRHEMGQLQDVLAAKKLREADLKARLSQVQQELATVVL
ncbi:hypothetical protein GGH99_008604, partial [Coemansia sp. RSA 1285]